MLELEGFLFIMQPGVWFSGQETLLFLVETSLELGSPDSYLIIQFAFF